MRGGNRHETIVRRIAAQQGQATAEYALILALVAVAAVAGYQLFGTAVAGLYSDFVAAVAAFT